MTSTCSASATALPLHHAFRELPSRRGFLSGLAALPLIGGSVALIGQPTAVAEPATLHLMENYKTWLLFESRCLAWEMADHPEIVARHEGLDRSRRSDAVASHAYLNNGAGRYHRYDGTAPASGRAALVLAAIGCNWREG